MANELSQYLGRFPFIAICRGIRPDEVRDCCRILMEAGFRVIEIPLNSPDPYQSIEILAEAGGNDLLAGAGTVTRIEQVHRVRACGGRLVVSPHCDPALIRETQRCDMVSLPGVVTPTEAMVALTAGASGLKLFPAELVTPQGVKALRAVLPEDIPLVPVGSIDASNWRAYRDCGAAGFGLGSSLYKAGITIQELENRARKLRESFVHLRASARPNGA